MASHESQSPYIWSVRPYVICPHPPPFWSHLLLCSLSVHSAPGTLAFSSNMPHTVLPQSVVICCIFIWDPLLLTSVTPAQMSLYRGALPWRLYLKSRFSPAPGLSVALSWLLFLVSTLFILLVCYLLPLEQGSKSGENWSSDSLTWSVYVPRGTQVF